MIAACKRALRADPLLAAAFFVLAAATVTPIWIGRYLPLLDLPNHLAAIAVWHEYADPRFDFSKYYTLNLAALPYWAHYYGCHLLAYVFGVEGANRVFLTLYALALPTGALLVARRFGRSPLLSLFAFPLVWSFNLAEGFIAFVAGMAMVLFGLVLADRHAERPGLGSALWLVLLGSSIYFFHLLDYMLFLVCAGLLVFTQPEPFKIRKLLARGLPVLACTAVGLWAFLRRSALGFADLSGAPRFNWDSLSETLTHAPERLLNVLSSSRDEWVVLVLGAAWLLLALTAARSRDPERPPWSLCELGIEACFLATLAAALLLPRSMLRPFNWYMINGRFVPMAALLGVLLLRGPILGWRRWLLFPVVAAGLFYAGSLARMVVRFNRHVAGFDQIVQEIPLHASTLTLVFPPLDDPQVNVNCYNEWAAYTQIRRGGYDAYNFDYGFPLVYRRYKPAPPASHPEWLNIDREGRAWDYFLTHNETGDHELFAPLAQAGRVRLVDQRGRWKLWQRIEPTKAAAPK